MIKGPWGQHTDPRIKHNQNLNAFNATIRIIIIYMVIGFLWILLSDRVVDLFDFDHETFVLIQSIKGTFYVLITAIVFYLIIHRQIEMYIMTIYDLKNAYVELDQGHRKSLSLEGKLYDLAFYDHLTGLPNKVMLEEKISERIKLHPTELIGFIYFDIDEFRNINEVKGHSCGDDLIKIISSTLKNKVQSPNMLARMGGDEFVLAIFDIKRLELFMPEVESYIELVRKSYVLEKDDFFVTFSGGIALYPDHGTNYITLLRHADAAMSIAKAKGKDQFVIFDDEMVTVIKQQTDILNNLRMAISNQEMSLHYQPIIDLKNGHTIGVEALIRWQHPTKGFIPPLEFISLSEKNGFIKEITEFVFKEAHDHYSNWEKQKKSFKISINLSATMLINDKFINSLLVWIQNEKLDCRKFNIEVTESAFISDIQKSIHVLNQLKRLGFTIALDDFGTGYSSLTYLQKLPIDSIKIDRSFINNIKEDTEEFYVLKYMIDLAHHLNLSVVAEGIETEEQALMVKKYGVDYAQGYYYCKPTTQVRVIEYIHETNLS
jgi:diguanylate cyclase